MCEWEKYFSWNSRAQQGVLRLFPWMNVKSSALSSTSCWAMITQPAQVSYRCAVHLSTQHKGVAIIRLSDVHLFHPHTWTNTGHSYTVVKVHLHLIKGFFLQNGSQKLPETQTFPKCSKHFSLNLYLPVVSLYSGLKRNITAWQCANKKIQVLCTCK